MRGQLSVGDTLEEVFSLYRAHAGVLLPIAFWLYLVVAILEGLVGEGVGQLLIVLLVGFVIGVLYQGTVVNLVRGVKEGNGEFSMRGLVDQALPYLPRLIAAGVLSGVAMTIGFALLLVPGLYLMTIWAVLAPAIVIEDSGVFEAFGRSRRLVRGSGWPVFGALVVALLITAVGGIALGALAQAIADGPLLEIVFGAIAATVTAPIGALVAGVIYYRLLAIQPPPAVEADSALE